MKKLVRFVIVLIGIVAAGILILGMVEPKQVTVSRSKLIKAPKDAVFAQIVNFKNWTNWSPWYKMDSGKMKITYQGTDGAEGSSYSWEGTDNTGAGDMKNTGVAGTQLNYEVTITKPYNFTSTGMLNAADTAGMTKATWNCVVKMSYPWNAAFIVLNVDKMLGGDFENGLENMKQYLESNHAANTTATVDIQEVDYPAHMFVGVRKTIGWADITQFFKEANAILYRDSGAKINGPLTGLFYTWDTTTKTTDAVACFPVSDTTMPIQGAAFFLVPAAKAYMAVQKGGYSTSMAYHAALAQYMAAKGQNHSVVIEEYAVSPQQQPDSNKWLTNIYYLVQ